MYEFMNEYMNEGSSGQKTCNIILRPFTNRGLWPVKCNYGVAAVTTAVHIQSLDL